MGAPPHHRREPGRDCAVYRLAVGGHRRPLPAAGRRRVGICGARGGGAADRTAAPFCGPTPGLDRALYVHPQGKRRRRNRSAPARAMHSACSTPEAMSGSGPVPAGTGPTSWKRAGFPGGTAACAFCGANIGISCRPFSGISAVAGVRQSPCPVVPAFAWSGIRSRRFGSGAGNPALNLSVYCGPILLSSLARKMPRSAFEGARRS